LSFSLNEKREDKKTVIFKAGSKISFPRASDSTKAFLRDAATVHLPITIAASELQKPEPSKPE
jgi:hypothetical protein